MMQAGIAIGSNLDHPFLQCQKALKALTNLPESRLIACSSFYHNEPLLPPHEENFQSVDWYVNAVCLVETALEPEVLLRELLGIEQKMGRVRRVKWESRVIDLDLLFYGSVILKTDDLILPHPEIGRRRFVLEPLREIAPDWVNPQTGESVSSLLQRV